MRLFNFLNPKSVTPATGQKSNVNALQSKQANHKKQDSISTARASDFFSFHGIGEALSPITVEQSGRIHFGGTDWPAQLIPQHTENRTECILQGMMVQVVGRQGITLLVSTV